jgi:hypothetical protein
MTAMRSVQSQMRTAVWLQSRDIVHLGGRRLLGPAIIATYLGVCLLLVAGGLAAHSQHQDLPLADVFTPIWLLWALLPAVGAGGGSLDATGSLAPYPTGTPMLLTSSWFSALIDVQYLLPVPVLFGGVAVEYGAAGLPGAVAFVIGASALGQLAGWFSVAGVRARRGQSLFITGCAVLALGALAVSRRSRDADARHLGTIPPTRWLVSGAHAAQHGDWPAAAGWWALLAMPVLLFVAVGPALVRRATLARLAGASARGSGGSFASTPWRAIAAAAWRGMVRTTSWRATLFAVVSVPFMTTLLSEPLSYRALASVVVVSAGATIAANTWAFEAGGVTVLLSAPVRRRTVVVARTAVLAAALATSLVVATAAALIAGPLEGSAADVGYAACVVLLVAAAGMRTSVATASATDVDSLRARPATLPAVLAFGGRCLFGLLVLSSAWHFGVIGALVCAGAAIGYVAWALRGAERRFADGASLLAAFATVR